MAEGAEIVGPRERNKSNVWLVTVAVVNSVASALCWLTYLNPDRWNDREAMALALAAVSAALLVVGGAATLLSARESMTRLKASLSGLLISVASIPISLALVIPAASANPFQALGEECSPLSQVGSVLGMASNLAVAYLIGYLLRPFASRKILYNTLVFLYIPLAILLYLLGFATSQTIAGHGPINSLIHEYVCQT